MKKIIVALAVLISFIAAPVAAHEGHSHAPKAGSACTMSGATMVEKNLTYVCLPSKKWTKGLKKSKAALTTKDMWAKAVDSGMTAAFGMITNPTNKDIRIIAARSPQYAGMLQLHQVVMDSATDTMVMQEKMGGFLVPANETIMLKPGGDHIMFMSLKKPITAGTEIPVTLIGSKGEQLQFKALAKVFAGANEDYDHSGM